MLHEKLPTMKLGSVQIICLTYRKSYLVVIFRNSHVKWWYIYLLRYIFFKFKFLFWNLCLNFDIENVSLEIEIVCLNSRLWAAWRPWTEINTYWSCWWQHACYLYVNQRRCQRDIELAVISPHITAYNIHVYSLMTQKYGDHITR